MWWKLIVIVLLLMVIFFIGGVYAASAVYQLLVFHQVYEVSFHTLIYAYESKAQYSLADRRLIFLPWASCVVAASTFLPLVITAFAFLGGSKKINKDLHGKARFANKKELEQFTYKGPYLEDE